MVTQPLGLFHQMCRQEDRLAAVAYIAHQIQDGPASLRVEPRGQLVQEHQLRVVDQRQRDEQPLFLITRERHEPGVALVGEPQLVEQPVAVDRRGVERCPEVDRLPDLDPFLELGLLELYTDSVLQRAGMSARVEPEDLDPAAVWPSQALDTLHRRSFSGAVRADQPEDLTRLHLERHVVNGDGSAVGLPDVGDADHRSPGHAGVNLTLFLSARSRHLGRDRLRCAIPRRLRRLRARHGAHSGTSLPTPCAAGRGRSGPTSLTPVERVPAS